MTASRKFRSASCTQEKINVCILPIQCIDKHNLAFIPVNDIISKINITLSNVYPHLIQCTTLTKVSHICKVDVYIMEHNSTLWWAILMPDLDQLL